MLYSTKSMEVTGTKTVVFNVSKSYHMKEILGKGAYGIVCSAVHKPSGVTVAIKKIEPFSKLLICLRTIRELKLLKFFNNHENIIGLYDVQKPKDFNDFHEIYLVQEFMPMDLHQVIHSQNLLDGQTQYLVYQIMRGLKAIHSANVIHRDLKPSNILVNYNCELKICDFGLARIYSPGYSSLMECQLTEYVATRWYRAPEIMLLRSNYNTSVDIWSVGCIMAEIFLGLPIFPGKDYRNQLMLIFSLLGTPGEEDLVCVKLLRAREYIQLLPQFDPVDVSDFINLHPKRIRKMGHLPVNPLGLDLMKQFLSFNPIFRPNAAISLQHDYFLQYHDASDEPISKVALKPETFDQNKSGLSIMELKKQLYEQVVAASSRTL